MPELHPSGVESTWPPEVPPFRPPGPPSEPPQRQPQPPPVPILPSWEELDPQLPYTSPEHRLLEERVVVVDGHLDDEKANRVAAQLLLVGRRNRRPLELHLSCGSSDLAASLLLADTVDLLAAPVHAVVRGTLRGPANAVLCAAAKRSAHRHAMFVLSTPASAGTGAAGRLSTAAAQHDHLMSQLQERIVGTTGRPDAEVSRDLSAGRLMSAADAVEYGLIEKIL
jgi:ATP-dependent Clp protease protease subunit